jgi:predicted 2-oxoglutarate/Fe(II)-dependent dioxygenase YbiX
MTYDDMDTVEAVAEKERAAWIAGNTDLAAALAQLEDNLRAQEDAE